MEGTKLLVGTGKGLVVFVRQSRHWNVAGVHFQGMPVNVVYVDERTHTWWVGLAHRHWGQKMHFSRDEGKTWEAVAPPKYAEGLEIYPGKPARLKKIWSIAHAGPDKPGGLWVGTEPGGLFYSPDHGRTFELVEGLWNHPSRLDQHQWFGAGRDFPFIHSIVVDPRDSDHVYIAVSCAGVFETTDGGKHWEPRNQGLCATYLPNPEVEVGHDPHLLLACRADPDVLWQQNHCGIYRSEDGGRNWQDVSGKDGFPYYGFALAIDHADPRRAWVIPAISDEERTAFDLALCVCRTEDGGRNWQAQRNGLPQEYCFDIVFRHSFFREGNCMAFGTTTGNVYLSEDEGAHWQCLSHSLARVESLVITSGLSSS